jgi:hypothetical protein
MTTIELKSALHQLIDNINDSKTLSVIYKFISSARKGKEKDKILTHLSSEITLSKDWNKPEEDKAWDYL